MSTRTRRSALFLVLTVLLTVVGAAGWSHAATFTVNSTADEVDSNPGDGTAATASGTVTLRAAIMEANALAGADTIILPAGTYTLTIAGDEEDGGATGDLDVTETLTIQGANAPTTTISAAGLGDRVFDLNPGAALNVVIIISGATISGGNATQDAGNSAGGGMIATGASGFSLTLNNVHVTGNTATTGGGLDKTGPGTVTITNSTFSANTATTVDGGGMAIGGGTATLTNVTVTGNTGTDGGGALFQAGVQVTANNTTFALNTATSDGGGFFLDTSGATAAALVLRNSIVAQNTAALTGAQCIGGAGITSDHNIYGDTTDCNITPGTGDNIAAGTSVVQPLGANGGQTPTHALAATSPAINAGDKATCAEKDQRGVTRDCDSGAFERITAQTTLIASLVRSASLLTLNVTVTNATAVPADVIVFFLTPTLTLPGCTAGNQAFFVNASNAIVPGCLTSHTSTIPVNRTLTIPPLSNTTVTVFATNVSGISGIVVTGGVLITPENALQDGLNFGSLAAGGDIIAIAASTTTL